MDQRPNRFYIIWMLAGVYLLYLVFQMVSSLRSNPMDAKAYVFAAVFAIAGIGFILKGIHMMKHSQQMMSSVEEEMDKEKDDLPEKSDTENINHVE